MGFTFPQCVLCKHYREGPVTGTCAAFPDGIPMEVYWTKVDHRLPYPGNNGVRLELSEEAKTGRLSLWADLHPLPEEQAPSEADGEPVEVEPPPVKRRKKR